MRLTDYLTLTKSYSTVQYTLFGFSLLGKERLGYWYSFCGSWLFPFSFSVAVVTGIECRSCITSSSFHRTPGDTFVFLFLSAAAAALR